MKKASSFFKTISMISFMSSVMSWLFYVVVFDMRTDHTVGDFARTLIFSMACVAVGLISCYIVSYIESVEKHNQSKKRVSEQIEEIAIRENRLFMNINV